MSYSGTVCLTCDAGLFYLIYTAVKRYGRTSQPGSVGAGLRGMHNNLVTCQTIDSKWLDPVYSGVL